MAEVVEVLVLVRMVMADCNSAVRKSVSSEMCLHSYQAVINIYSESIAKDSRGLCLSRGTAVRSVVVLGLLNWIFGSALLEALFIGRFFFYSLSPILWDWTDLGRCFGSFCNFSIKYLKLILFSAA